jgi:chemotaxis response regulator CheB
MLEEDFNVRTANNGLEALDIVIANPRNYFDAIVLDINMPIMDGFETYEKITKYLWSKNVIQIVDIPDVNQKELFDDDEEGQSMFLLHEETKRKMNPVREQEREGWQKEKRPFIYAYTGDLNPHIETKTK